MLAHSEQKLPSILCIKFCFLFVRIYVRSVLQRLKKTAVVLVATKKVRRLNEAKGAFLFLQ